MDQAGVNLLELHKGELCKKIIPSQLCTHLGTLLNFDEIRDITTLEKTDRPAAVLKLLEILRSSDDQNWFNKFKASLKETGCEPLFKLMNFEDVKDKKNFEILIRSKLKAITSQVEPIQIIISLLASRTITESDAQLVFAEQKNHGAQNGVMKLLTILPYRKETWFSDFITALRNNGYNDLVELIDPRLRYASSDDSLLKHCSNIRNQDPNTLADNARPNEEDYRTMETKVMHCSVAAEPDLNVYAMPDVDHGRDGRDSLRQSDKGEVQRSRSITATVLPQPRRASPEGREGGTAESSSTNVSAQDADADRIHSRSMSREAATPAPQETRRKRLSDDDNDDLEQSQHDSANSGRAAENVQETSRKLFCEDLTELNVSNNSRDNLNLSAMDHDGLTCSGPYSEPDFDFQSGILPVPQEGNSSGNSRAADNQIVNQMRENEQGSNDNNIEIRNRNQINETERNTGPDSAAQHSNSQSTSVNSAKKELKLHSYQEEVLEDMLDGKNVMMCLPTGTGKTCVAIARAQSLLDDADIADEPKIAFIVPTVALVEQQLAAFRTFLKGNWTCTGLSGDMEEAALPLGEVLQRVDVIVMTPQILLNALEKEHIKSLGDFSAIFFDECHHTTKDHPYNKIMAEYYVDKILEEEQIEDLSVARVSNSLPQIIGLTASPGVGKGGSMNEAMNHILELCANLASARVSIVQRNVEELQSCTNNPNDDNIPVSPRLNDDFRSEICRLMQEVENMLLTQESITNKENLRRVIQQIPNIESLLKAPSASRGKDPYLQFLSKLKHDVAPANDRELKITTMSAQRHLEIYNVSLIINEDCRTFDAMKYLNEQMEEVSTVTDTDKRLNDMYRRNVAKLKEISQSKQQDNPKLEKLKRLILRYYETDKNSQGIVFCKTREMTSALVNWIQDDQEVSWLNPAILVGTQKSGTGSYSKAKLEEALDQFRKGKHKLIFATTVAEEGLDIKQCNYVIRYEYATNSIGRTQAKGRVRNQEDGAGYILVSDPSRGNIAHDFANKIRESMMIKALQQVHDLPPQDFQRRVREFQHLARLDRQRGKAAEEVKQKQREQRRRYDEYELICIKCNKHCTFNTNIRVIQGTHHVLIDPDFRSKATLQPHPSPKKISCGMEKKDKLLCKECGEDWGITASYQGVVYPVLKIISFVIVDPNQKKSTAKKWKDVLFPLQEHSIVDAERMSNSLK